LAAGAICLLVPMKSVASTTRVENSAVEDYEGRVRSMLSGKDWAGLTRFMEQARQRRERMVPFEDSLHLAYRTLSKIELDTTESQRKNDFAVWHAQCPAEPAPLIAMAWIAVDRNRTAARELEDVAPLNAATGRRPKVTGKALAEYEEITRRMAESSLEAHGWLDQAGKCGKTDPELWTCRIALGDADAMPRESMQRLLARGREVDPGYVPLYQWAAEYLAGRGKPGEWLEFAGHTADVLKRDDIYAQIVYAVWVGNESRARIRMMPEEWRRIERGIEALGREYPDSACLLNRHAFLAVRARRYTEAARIFRRIGDDYDARVWESEDEFEKFQESADDKEETGSSVLFTLTGCAMLFALATLTAFLLSRGDDRRPRTVPPASAVTLKFRGGAKPLLKIMLANLILTVATLGIYSFWGRARTRRYLWDSMELGGDAFAWHGTGGETFRGFTKAFLMFGIPYGATLLAPRFLHLGYVSLVILWLGGILVLLLFIPMAVVGARRYRLTRTSWRGIRFGYGGSALRYAAAFWWQGFLSVITLGVRAPWFKAATWGRLWSGTRFGTKAMRFSGAPRELLKAILVMMLGIVGGAFVFFVLAMAVELFPGTTLKAWVGEFWLVGTAVASGWAVINYRVKQAVWLWAHTRVGRARFVYDPTVAQYAWLVLGNYAIFVLTLGLGWSWTQLRTGRFYARHLWLEGTANFGRVRPAGRNLAKVSAAGEDYSAMFGLDLDLG